MARRNRISFLLSIALIVLAAPLLFAQQTGSIQGRITTDGQPLPGVTVEARSNVLPQARVTTSAANGDYRFPQLPPGSYTVTFTLSGLRTQTRNISVFLDQASTVNVNMALAAVAEEITVTADSPLIDATSTAIKSAVSEQVIEQVPTGQDYRDLVKLAPAVQYTEDTIRGPSAGGSGQDNVYQFDGVNVTLPLFGTLSAEPSSHDIEQVSFIKGGAKALDFNRAGGFTIDSVSRSGTSEWSGEVKYQVQSDSMTADVDDDSASQFDEDLAWATLGVGGPLVRDRLFFYGSYYHPTIDRANASNLYGEIPGYERTRDEFFGKLTFTPTGRLLLHGSYRDSDREDRFDSISVDEHPSTSAGAESKQTIAILEGSWVISNRSFATAKFTDYGLDGLGRPDNLLGVSPSTTLGTMLDLNNLDQMGYVNVPTLIDTLPAYNEFVTPFIERYGYLANGQRVGGGAVGGYFQINDQDFFRQSGQIGYDFTIGEDVTHDIHVGFQRYVDEEDLARLSNGWGIIDVNGGRSVCPSNTECSGDPYYFLATVQRPNVGADQVVHSEFHSNNIELNDTIQWGNWAFNVGVLLSNDILYGEGLREDPSEPSGFTPAPGNEYKMYEIDFGEQIQPRVGATWAYNGVDTAYVSYARYNPAASSLPRAAAWDRNTILLTSEVYFDAEGRVIGSRQLRSSSGKFFDDDLDPRYTDEYLIGTSQQFNNRLSARAYGRYRYSTNFWEDTNNNARIEFEPPAGVPEELYIDYVSPGSYVIAELDGAFTKYYEATVESDWHATDRMFLRGSYTFSRYYGNFDQDNTSTGNDDNIFIGSSNLADGAGRQIWDNKYGDLRADRPHLLKVYGYYSLPWNATTGAFAVYQSGHAWEAWDYRPYSHLTGSTSITNRYAEPAGSRRTDSHYQLDLNYTQNIPVGGVNLQLIADVYNLTDNQTGYNPQPSLLSPTFGESRSFYRPRRFQIAAKVQF